jgi:MinD superfamily P-loop ATPase
MQSKNKKAPTKAEKAHIERIKSMRCGVCDANAPSEAHELKQGQWFTSLPLCPDCHRGSINGIHGQARIWAVYKLDEQAVLNETIRQLMESA